MIIFFLMLLALAGCDRPGMRDDSPKKPAPEPTVPSRSTVGNGSDLPPLDDGSAWFLGDRPIRYCLARNTAFGFPVEDAAKLIRDAFVAWQAYLSEAKVNERHGGIGDYDLPKEHPALVLNHRALPSCDGTQDLTFFLGGTNPEISSLRHTFHRPLAFASRGTYDIARGWSAGSFIWVAQAGFFGTYPRWNDDPYSLEKVFQHELGHVLGCGHVPSTVMDAELARGIQYLDAFESDRPLGMGIDHGWPRQLLFPANGSISRRIRAHYTPALVLDLLDSRFPEFPGFSRGTLDFESLGPSAKGVISLFFAKADGDAAEVLELVGLRQIASLPSEAALFKTVLRMGDTVFFRESRAPALAYRGKLRSRRTGRELEVSVVRNGSDSSFLIHGVSSSIEGLSLDFSPWEQKITGR